MLEISVDAGVAKPRPGVRELPFLQRALYCSVALYAGTALANTAFGSISVGSIAKYATLPIVFFGAIAYRQTKHGYVNPSVIALYGITVLACLSYFWSIDSSVTVSRAVTLFELLVACIALSGSLRVLGERGIQAVVAGLMIGALSAALAVFYASANHSFVDASNYGRLVARATAGAADPNDIALCMALSVPVFLSQQRLSLKLGVIPIGIAILLTGSRTGIVALAATLIAIIGVRIFSNRQRRDGSGIRLWQVVLFTVGVVALGSMVLPEAVVTRIASVPSALTGSTLTNRTVLWSAAWHGFLQHPLTGIGSGASPLFELRNSGYELVTHNVYLTLLLEMGIFGLFIFLIAVWVGFSGSIKGGRAAPWLFPSLVGLVIGSYALSWDYNKLLWLLLVVAGYLHTIYRPGLVVRDP